MTSMLTIPLTAELKVEQGKLYVQVQGSLVVDLETLFPGSPATPALGLIGQLMVGRDLPPGGIGVSPASRPGQTDVLLRSPGGTLGTWTWPSRVPDGACWWQWLDAGRYAAREVVFLGTCAELSPANLTTRINEFAQRNMECRLYAERWGLVT